MHLARTTTRRRSRAALAVGAALVAAATGVLTPSSADAAPRTAAQATAAAEKAANDLAVIDEQVHQAELTVGQQQAAAHKAARAAAVAKAAMKAYEPQLRAIAQTGYTSNSQSRVAAFLTAKSAGELVQRVATLDMIATHTNQVISGAAAAQRAAAEAQAQADRAAATATTGLKQLQEQQAQVKKQIADYEGLFARLSATEQATVTNALAGPALAVPDQLPLAPTEAAAIAVKTALAQVGDRYVWGTSGPDTFDCSGLTSYAYAAAGVSLPHSSRAQAGLGRAVSRAELQPGDLVYFFSPVSHIGLYIGGGMMVHARTSGRPVAVTSVDMAGYKGARRIVG